MSACVLITLDTTPPTVTWSAPVKVGADFVVGYTADESLAGAVMHTVSGPVDMRVRPTRLIAAWPGERAVRIVATDDVGNASQAFTVGLSEPGAYRIAKRSTAGVTASAKPGRTMLVQVLDPTTGQMTKPTPGRTST